MNSWTKILHNHQIKWGVDLRRVRDDLLQDQTFSPRGVIYFRRQPDHAQTCTVHGNAAHRLHQLASNGLANDMASFLLDVPNQVARDVNTYFPALRQWQIFAYVADNWQVSSETDCQPGPALGILCTADARISRAVLELQSRQQHAGDRRHWQVIR